MSGRAAGADELLQVTPMTTADPTISHLRSNRSMIGTDSADPIGYPRKLIAAYPSEVTTPIVYAQAM